MGFFSPTRAQAQAFAAETGMGELQARYHLMARRKLERDATRARYAGARSIR